MPFGHGLSYTQFEWKAEILEEAIAPGDSAHVRVTLRNIGPRPGSEVVQAYVAPPPGGLFRPSKELAGFAKLHLEPGEQQSVEIELPARAFSYWHPGDEMISGLRRQLANAPFGNGDSVPARRRGWVIEPGTYRVFISRSSTDTIETFPLQIDGLSDGRQE